MERIKLLAAEIYNYSYDNYADHEGNRRFDVYMPRDAAILEKAAADNWPPEKVAKQLNVEIYEAKVLLSNTYRALKIIDAPNPAESFRNGVRFSIQDAIPKGTLTDEQIETLVTQICYRTADLIHLLKTKSEKLSDCSEHLRRETDIDYSHGFFDFEEVEKKKMGMKMMIESIRLSIVL